MYEGNNYLIDKLKVVIPPPMTIDRGMIVFLSINSSFYTKTNGGLIMNDEELRKSVKMFKVLHCITYK